MESFIDDIDIAERIKYVCRCPTNRAGARFLITCSLAKITEPSVDIRKPYTESGDDDTFSGRNYDETYVTQFVTEYGLPCNYSSAFVTPAFRTKKITLDRNVELVGNPKRLYQSVIELLDDVHSGRISAETLLLESIRCLLLLKDERETRLDALLSELTPTDDELAPSTEQIVLLIKQHLAVPRSSRLPVLLVAAAYETVTDELGERISPLRVHTAADEQTGALGDIEIVLRNDKRIATCYEMKSKKVVQNDIDRALEKIRKSALKIDNYIFVTTSKIDEDVAQYARNLYKETNGIEFAILDILGFVRHFLHLFHRSRVSFLNQYQEILLTESDSSVSHAVKEAFLVLRRALETELQSY